jgi:hypothetical protein
MGYFLSNITVPYYFLALEIGKDCGLIFICERTTCFIVHIVYIMV